MNDPTTSSPLQTYLGIARRRWLLIVAVIFGCVLAGLVQLSRQTPQYQAVSQILLDQVIIPSNGGVGIYLAERQLENDLAFANSPLVGEEMAAELGYRPAVSASSVNADVVSFIAVSASSTAAAVEANLFAETFIKARRDRLRDTFTSTIAERETVIADLQGERAALDPNDPLSVTRGNTLDSQIAGLIIQRDDLRLSARIQSAGGATVISPALPPGAPFAPDRNRTMALALAFGFICAAAAAWLREFFDDTIRSREDLDRATGDLDYLGALPRDRGRAAENPALVAEHGPLDEAFRSLRTSVQFVGLRHPLRSVQITSANSAEGKTTTAAYLAVAMAQAGERVVLIDGDLRNPNLHHRFGLPKEPGLTDLLIGTTTAAEAYHFVPTGTELWVVPSGTTPGNPANFLWSASAPANGPSLLPFVRALIERGFLVVIDSPPTLPVADALTLSHMVDGTLLVVAAGKTGARSVARAVEQLRQADATIIGTVLNGLADTHTRYGYAYGYGSRRHSRFKLARRRRKRRSPPQPTSTPKPAVRPPNAQPVPAAARATNGFASPTAGVAHKAQHSDQPRVANTGIPLDVGAMVPGPDGATLTKDLRALIGTRAEPTAPALRAGHGNGSLPPSV